MVLEFEPYTAPEKKKLIELYSERPIDAPALDFLEARVKPTAGEVVSLCNRLNLGVEKKVDLAGAKECIRKLGLAPMGLTKHDVDILKRIYSAPAGRGVTADVLMNVCGDKQLKVTKGRVGWLMFMGLLDGSKSGYIATKACVKYLEELASSVKAAKAKAASKRQPEEAKLGK